MSTLLTLAACLLCIVGTEAAPQAVPQGGGTAASKKLQDGLLLLNEHLKQQVPDSDELGANLDAARRQVSKIPLLESSLQLAAKHLVQTLAAPTGGPACNQNRVDHFMRLSAATGSRQPSESKSQPLDRIDRLLNGENLLKVNLVADCRQFYERQHLDWATNELHPRVRLAVEELMNDTFADGQVQPDAIRVVLAHSAERLETDKYAELVSLATGVGTEPAVASSQSSSSSRAQSFVAFMLRHFKRNVQPTCKAFVNTMRHPVNPAHEFQLVLRNRYHLEQFKYSQELEEDSTRLVLCELLLGQSIERAVGDEAAGLFEDLARSQSASSSSGN